MAFAFRTRHNLLISIIDYLTAQIGASWSDVNVAKSFAEVTQVDIPAVCISLGDPTHTRLETGSMTLREEYPILINIFETSDSRRMDLVDFIIEKINTPFTYYTCVNDANHDIQKTSAGKVTLIRIDVDTPIEADEATNKKEKFRHELIARFRVDAS